ncbi:MAG: TIGR04086 family membrane protein [Clostridia bacterium]|nr:TIGR04086 family membrane protein [Clostridia bacterium]
MSFLKKYKSSFVKYSVFYFVSVTTYFLSFFVFNLILSLICKNSNLAENIINILCYFFMGISGFVCGYFAGILFKKKGIIVSIIINILLFLIKYCFSTFILDRSAFLPNFYIVILIDFISVFIGCVMAINKKPKKYY